MAHSYTAVGGYGDFTVVKSTPSGTIVVFTLTDTINQVTSVRMIRALLCDAIQQWIDAERADLDTNGDTAVTGADVNRPGNGFGEFSFDFENKTATVTLTALTNVSTTGNLTVSIPYADVV